MRNSMQSPLPRRIRELDHRNRDGLDVRLVWELRTNSVSVIVEDERSGESLAFEVAGAEALAAFRHPYAYADQLRGPHSSHAPFQLVEPHEPR
jgi:hypothetical protein